MARTIGRLTALKVENAKKPGMYADGGGVYLQVTGPNAKSWICRYWLNKSAHETGLGPLSAIKIDHSTNWRPAFLMQLYSTSISVLR